MEAEQKGKTSRGRLVVLASVLVIAALLVVGRLVYYQVFNYGELKAWALEQRQRERDLTPERGTILDATGHPLALSVVQWDVSVSPPLVTDPDQVAKDLAPLLGMSQDELYAKITTEAQWVLLAKHLPQATGEAIIDLDHNGITCEAQPLRVYPEGSLVAHAIGIVNDTGVGYYGIEGYYNERLKGVEGKKQIEQDPAGAELPLVPQEQLLPQSGTSLLITIDRNAQLIAVEELERAIKEYQADGGTVLIMDPKTGAVLALASYPSYNPNSFASGNLELLADPSLSQMWEPGSIFKVVTWAAGLDSGTISPGTTMYDSGALEVGGRVIQNWDRQGRGTVTMADGLAYSLNTVAAYISTSMGKDTFYTYVRRFGFGRLSGIDLDSEGPGMVKLPGDSNWFPSDLGTNAFGQGIAVTPVQMLSAVSAIANEGLLMKPYVVRQFISADKVLSVEPMAVRQVISQDTAETLTNLMVEVVDREAKKAKVPGYRIAGKTGTAQIPTAYGYHPTDTIASFIGFAPADDPQFAILIKLDRPKASPWANHTAAPTFQAIAQRLLVYMQIPPDEVRLGVYGQ